jgi:hypothetical protein
MVVVYYVKVDVVIPISENCISFVSLSIALQIVDVYHKNVMTVNLQKNVQIAVGMNAIVFFATSPILCYLSHNSIMDRTNRAICV